MPIGHFFNGCSDYRVLVETKPYNKFIDLQFYECRICGSLFTKSIMLSDATIEARQSKKPKKEKQPWLKK